jgi:aspartyl-tRNA(Asn)/glutamyl-tRNA(Gln) amidotransferase subunit B
MLGPLRQWLNDHQLNFSQVPVTASNLAQMIDMIESGELSFSTAVSRLVPALIKEKKSPRELAETLNILQTANENLLSEWIQEVMNIMPDKVQEYRKGKKGLLGLFIGEIKKISGGKADPQKVTQLLQEKLNQP